MCPSPAGGFSNKFFLGERTAYSAALLPGCSNPRNLAACNQLLPFGPRSNVSVQRQWLNWWAEMLNTVVMPVYAPTPSRRLQLFSQPRELLRMPQLIPPTSAGRCSTAGDLQPFVRSGLLQACVLHRSVRSVSAWLPLDLDERLRQVPARLLSGQARLSELRAVL